MGTPSNVYAYYTSVLLPREPVQLSQNPQQVVAVIHHLHICENDFCVMVSPAIWWQYVELQHGSDIWIRLTLLKYNIKLFCSYSLIHSSAHHEILCHISYATVKV